MEINKTKFRKKLDIISFFLALALYILLIATIALFFEYNQDKADEPIIISVELASASSGCCGKRDSNTQLIAKTFGDSASLLNLLKTTQPQKKEQPQDKRQEKKIKKEEKEPQKSDEAPPVKFKKQPKQKSQNPKITDKEVEKHVQKPSQKSASSSVQQALSSGQTDVQNGTGIGANRGVGAGDGQSQDFGTDQNQDLALIRQAIERHKKYPPTAQKMRMQGVCEIEFILLVSGAVKDVKVTKSSGKQLLDDAALQAVGDASVEFPKVTKDRRISFELKFTSS